MSLWLRMMTTFEVFTATKTEFVVFWVVTQQLIKARVLRGLVVLV